MILALQTFIIAFKIFFASIAHTHFLCKIKKNMVLTFTINCFDCCACIAENIATYSAVMLAVEETKTLAARHALCDLGVWYLIFEYYIVYNNSYPDLAIKFIILPIFS